MDGILNINKPAGKTSYTIVAAVKRLTGVRRVGHAGTLDPAATGVLPVCLGQATRIVEYLFDASKTYRAEIELGVTTDTYDACGKVLRRADASNIVREQVESSLALFVGLIEQTPPMYSAVHHRGQKLYKLARAGMEVERQSRPAVVHRLEVITWQSPFVTIDVECGKGTYIRSLAHDLGGKLGCGASLKSLIRLSCGIFDIESAVSMPQLEEACRRGDWRRLVYSFDGVLAHWKVVVLSWANEDKVRKGQPLALSVSDVQGSARCRAYTEDGCFLGVLHFETESGLWRPEKVFSQRVGSDSN